MQKRGVSRLFVQIFLSHSTEKFRWGTLRCFKKFRVSKNFMHKKGLSLFSLQTFLSHSAHKLRKGTILCFRNILVGKNFMDKREVITILSKIFCVTVPKNFIREQFGVSEKFFYRNFSCIGGGASQFCRKFFVSQDRNEKLCKGTLLFSRKFLVSKKYYGWEGGITFFVENFLSHSAEKFLWGTL